MMDFEDDYLGILQNMEFMTIQIYRQHADLTDFQADKAFEGLLRFYQAEKRGKSAPLLKLGPLDQQIYENVKSVCEFYLGRPSTFKEALDDWDDEDDMESSSQEEKAEMLKKIKADPEILKKIKANLGLSEDDEIEIKLSEKDVPDITVDEIIACIKRIRSSISLWTKQSGRQGYLTFIDPFLP